MRLQHPIDETHVYFISNREERCTHVLHTTLDEVTDGELADRLFDGGQTFLLRPEVEVSLPRPRGTSAALILRINFAEVLGLATDDLAPAAVGRSSIM